MRLENVFTIPSKLKKGALLLVLMTWALAGLGCDQSGDVKEISLQESDRIQVLPAPAQREKSFRIAVAAMISPGETFGFYKEILAYLSQKMSLPVKLVQRETYEEINNLLKKNDLDAAWVCTGAYVDGHDDFGMELLVAPVVSGKQVYHSYTIVPQDSPARTFSDLRGKTFAFTDPLSNTGRLSPLYTLAMMGEDEKLFFSRVIFTYSHDKSIEAVARKMVDGAAVDSLIWDYMNFKDPRYTSKTRIIGKSAPYGIPPVVVPKGLDHQRKEELRSILLHMHENARGREVLSKIRIDRFMEVSDGIYDNVRTMQKRIREKK